MPNAELLIRQRNELPDGFLIEIKVWHLPDADQERPHRLEYSLYCGRYGKRLIAYDNERGKGDHRHIEAREEPYRFVSLEQLLADFYADVKTVMMRKE